MMIATFNMPVLLEVLARPEASGPKAALPSEAVVFADSECVQPDLIGMLDLLDQVAQTVGCADRKTVVVEGRGEAIDADLHWKGHRVGDPPTGVWPYLAPAAGRDPSHQGIYTPRSHWS
jgi:hypothetical protein